MKPLTTTRLCYLALMASISILLVYIYRQPLFLPFLEYDAADVPIFLTVVLFGPWEGALLTILVSVIQGLTVSAGSGPIGIMMHIVATGSFAVVAGMIIHGRGAADWRKGKTGERKPLLLWLLVFAAELLLLTAVIAVVEGAFPIPKPAAIAIAIVLVVLGVGVFAAGLRLRGIRGPGGTAPERRAHTRGRIAAGFGAGVGVMVVLMVLWNLLLTPLYLHQSIEKIAQLLLPAIIPFNLIKAGVNAALAFGLYVLLQKRAGRMLAAL